MKKLNLQKGRIYLKQGKWMVRHVTRQRVKGGSPKQLGSYNTVTVANYIPIREEDTLNLRDPYDQGKETCFELILVNEIENGYKNQPPGTVGFVAETKPVWYAKLWSTSEMVQDLQHYLETTPQEQQGLGDTIAKITNTLGIDKLAEELAQAIGKKDCGCKKRQQKLNEMFPYKK